MNLSLIDLSLIDVLGFVAALSVLASFCMTTILALRSFALLSNVLFIVYGLLAQVYPVFFLHLVLLPVNIAKLRRLQMETRSLPDQRNGIERNKLPAR
ncbi:hypothetical protein JQ629_32635 [Bradyrhizobium sp. AUGA SZCCT0222]|uniref:hypothetical protein n=1 Tax=Bradyrhizobium sp. AUGA SZCCT0222 TaxID=2807668 RepID=UPI001BA6127B|nr:hypothetical protein [Bradyrhizobium sp. AUGA SZCCT0222]MBR1272230.1 hypothetical protein [Bradyrhizobium sp. AUGA SZCCT0222]